MKLKRTIVALLTSLSIICVPASVCAETATPNEESISMHIISVEKMSDAEINAHNMLGNHETTGLTEINPITRGLSRPDTAWDLSTGDYSFSGSASNSDLYTNYYFTGYTKYQVQIKNYSNTTLTAKVKTFWSTKEELTVAPGYTVNAECSGFQIDDKAYILFQAPSDFSGWIRKLG